MPMKIFEMAQKKIVAIFLELPNRDYIGHATPTSSMWAALLAMDFRVVKALDSGVGVQREYRRAAHC